MYSSVSTMELNWCRIMYNESTYISDNYLEQSKVMKLLYLPINNYKEILYNEPISFVTNWATGMYKYWLKIYNINENVALLS